MKSFAHFCWHWIKTGGAPLLLCTALFSVLVTIGALFPLPAIIQSAKEAMQTRMLEKNEYPLSPTAHFIDNFTECGTLSIAMDPNSSLVERAFAPRYITKTQMPCQDLATELFQPDDPGLTRHYYYRYWHGDVLVWRVGLTLLSYVKLRYLVNLLLWCTVIWAAIALWRMTANLAASLTLLGVMIALTDWQSFTPLVTHSVFWIVTLAGFAWQLGRDPERLLQPESTLRYAVVVASACVFFDRITTSQFGFALTVFVVLLAAFRVDAPHQRTLKAMTAAALGWAGGFGGTFLLKQLVAALLMPNGPVVKDFIETVQFRLGVINSSNIQQGLFKTTHIVLETIGMYSIFSKETTWWLLAMIVAAYLLRSLQLFADKRHAELKRYLLALIPASIPVLWFEVTTNHTQIHVRNFAARPLFIVPAVLLTTLILSLQTRAAAPVQEALPQKKKRGR